MATLMESDLTPDGLPVSAKVRHPKHYNNSPAKCKRCGCPIECIDIVQHRGFCDGNAEKYLWRAGEKLNSDGDDDLGIEDLEKAVEYIRFEIERRKMLLAARIAKQETQRIYLEIKGQNP